MEIVIGIAKMLLSHMLKESLMTATNSPNAFAFEYKGPCESGNEFKFISTPLDICQRMYNYPIRGENVYTKVCNDTGISYSTCDSTVSYTSLQSNVFPITITMQLCIAKATEVKF
jgi:hypothetical protein